MGCRLTDRICATSKNWRTQSGASDAAPIHFAPVRQLRQFLIGRGKGGALAQHHLAPSRGTALRRHTAGWRLRLADHALARSPDRQTPRRTDHVGSVGKGLNSPHRRQEHVDIQRRPLARSTPDRASALQPGPGIRLLRSDALTRGQRTRSPAGLLASLPAPPPWPFTMCLPTTAFASTIALKPLNARLNGWPRHV